MSEKTSAGDPANPSPLSESTFKSLSPPPIPTEPLALRWGEHQDRSPSPTASDSEHSFSGASSSGSGFDDTQEGDNSALSSDPEDGKLSDWESEDEGNGVTACEALGESFEREAASEGNVKLSCSELPAFLHILMELRRPQTIRGGLAHPTRTVFEVAG